MRNILSVFIFSLALAGLTSCSHEIKKPNTDTAKFVLSDTMAKIIKLDEVTMGRVDGIVSLNGEVTYDQNNVIKVMPIVSGICQDVKVNLGDRVTQGQALATVKSTEAVGLQNDLVAARSGEAIAKKNLEVTQSMVDKGVASQRDLLQAQQDLAKAESELNRVTNQLSLIGTSTNSKGALVQLTAPESGFIVERKLNPNQLIRPDDGTPLFTVSDLKKVWVMANVYEVDVEKVKVGDSVIVKTMAHPDKIFYGKIDLVSNALDPVARTLQVRVVLDNPDYLLKPQMYARVAVSFKEQDQQMPYVPSEAIVFDRSRNYVVVYHAKDDLEIREVEVLDAQGIRTYITSGLKPGEKVLSKSALMIYQAIRQ
jgi:cobalt-zinc-cadmium efflux system membrane fusion protein